MAPWQVILFMVGATAIIVLLTRYVSLGVLVSTAVGAIWMLVLIAQKPTNVPDSYGIYAVSVAVMIWVRHWKNIVSLIAGRERRLGERAS
jgi:glycerol-3-phosphate acyltransferase PlsY